MGSFTYPTKAMKNTIVGTGVLVVGTVQRFAEAAAFVVDLSAWAGREVCIHVTGTTRARWSITSSTTIDAATESADASAPVANGAGFLYSGIPNFRDVPMLHDKGTGDGCFLVLSPVAAAIDVVIEVSS